MRRLAIVSAVVVAGAFLLGYGMSRGDRATAPVQMPTVVDEVRQALSARYYRPVSPDVLRLASVRAMLHALGDPYTAYLPSADYAVLRQETSGSYSGIGVSVVPSRSGLVVVAVHPGPAIAAGLRVGDRIVRIGGDSAAGLRPEQALAQVSGPPGTLVRLEFFRQGRPYWVSVARSQLRAPQVAGRVVGSQGRLWGVVPVDGFPLGTARSLRHAIRRLERSGVSGLVLDLRGDPGGLLSEAVSVASLFLDGGAVVTLSGAHSPAKVYSARSGVATRLPLVVLVDRETASSAEVVAAALRDHHRAEIVGTRTYGKALVQSVDPLADGGALELTVARYSTPAGRDISGIGLRPDVPAADSPRTDSDEALSAALHALAAPAS
jgi:carboxyl-terminal processing protease